jgi:hypothetical protein
VVRVWGATDIVVCIGVGVGCSNDEYHITYLCILISPVSTYPTVRQILILMCACMMG